jgi:uncharacterized protein YdhG (YjbR/CyaY superfamily)
MKKTSNKPHAIEPGGVEEYIAEWPNEIQDKLRDIRSEIREVAPDAIETCDNQFESIKGKNAEIHSFLCALEPRLLYPIWVMQRNCKLNYNLI